jgi:hypothetical protein
MNIERGDLIFLDNLDKELFVNIIPGFYIVVDVIPETYGHRKKIEVDRNCAAEGVRGINKTILGTNNYRVIKI